MGEFKLTQLLIAVCLTLLTQVFLEILSSTLFPSFGLHEFRLSFNILIVLFLAFKFNSVFLPFLILLVQWLHSSFSIEGWALGTFAGVIISILVTYTKELLQFSSKGSTVVVVLIFQVVWFLITSIIFSLKIGNLSHIWERVPFFLPECLILGILSPFFFAYLSQIWKFLDKRDGIEL